MKLFNIWLLLFAFIISCSPENDESAQSGIAIFDELDAEIERCGVYDSIKEQRIRQLRAELQSCRNEDRKSELLDRIIGEYNAYNADSALHYVSRSLNRDVVNTDIPMKRRLLLKRADIMAHAGMFSDAQAILAGIAPNDIGEDLKEEYYATYCALYQYLSEYNSEHETAGEYERLRAQYVDSLNMVIDPESFNHLVYVMTQKARQGQAEEAITVLKKHIDDYHSGQREYSILASTLAYICKTSGRHEDYKRYLALSAISDIRGAVKENMSFREVATVMFEDGDVERANRYLKKSISDANFYAGMMRNVQSSKMLPLIDDAYASMQAQLTRRLRTMAGISLALSAVLIITIIFILKQFRSLRRANAHVKEANDKLSSLSEDLKDANLALTGKNRELHSISDALRGANAQLEERNDLLNEYNRTKEQYAGLFMENCSSAISTLHQYQKSLRILASQGAKSALMKKLESSEMADAMLKNFYKNFDEAILNIYPDFVENFNSLLSPGEEVILKKGMLLNTELRLFALIRLGIYDNEKIADFLRCSISTVYTYRSKIKKRAKNPDTFERDVCSL